MPFKSAELKDLAERAWGLGAQVSASTLASWFRHGELQGLVWWLEYYLKQMEGWKMQRDTAAQQLDYTRKYRDHAVAEINRHYNNAQVWQQRYEQFLEELDQLEPRYKTCAAQMRPSPECVDVINRYHWIKQVALPTCSDNYQRERADELFWRDEYRRALRKIQLLQTQLDDLDWSIKDAEKELREKWRMHL